MKILPPDNTKIKCKYSYKYLGMKITMNGRSIYNIVSRLEIFDQYHLKQHNLKKLKFIKIPMHKTIIENITIYVFQL